MLSRRVASALAGTVAAFTLGAAGAATADNGPSVDVGGCEFEMFCVGASSPGSSGKQPAGGTDDARSGDGSGSAQPPVCTVKKMEPQPPPGSQYWQGHNPKTTTLYIRSCPYFMREGASAMFDEPVWAPNGTEPEALNPIVLAQQAVDKMRLSGPEIGMAPRLGATGLVGMPVWMWTETGPTTYGPNTASATAGGITVSATAKVSKIVWSMGDGSTVTCAGPGTRYEPAYGKRPSPTCGHTYSRTSRDESSGRYTVSATSTWVIDWQVTGGASGGQLTETRTSQAEVAIGEMQAVG
ncbi:ATP/GTP-binding protein [Streptomyces sp. NPDC002835]